MSAWSHVCGSSFVELGQRCGGLAGAVVLRPEGAQQDAVALGQCRFGLLIAPEGSEGPALSGEQPADQLVPGGQVAAARCFQGA